MRVRVLLADDHALVRAGLRKLLESLPDIASPVRYAIRVGIISSE